MSRDRSRALLAAAFIVAMFYIALGHAVQAGGVLLPPSDECAGAVNASECYQLYIADRLYERHAVDVGAATFVGGAGPALLVLGAAAVTIGMVRGARIR